MKETAVIIASTTVQIPTEAGNDFIASVVFGIGIFYSSTFPVYLWQTVDKDNRFCKDSDRLFLEWRPSELLQDTD